MPSPSIFEPADRRPLRILIVDDDEDTAYLSSTLLETKGHEVESALGGESALSRVESFAPDLVILDVVMPGLDGIEVGRQIRQMFLPIEPTLAACSGLAAPKVRRACAEAGFDHFVVKPIEMPALDRLIDLVRGMPRDLARFDELVTRFESSAYAFTWTQLEFCELVLDSLPKARDKIIRQRQILRLHRVIAIASAWLNLQAGMPMEKRFRMEEAIAALYRRLDILGG